MKAFVITAPKAFEIQSVTPPIPGPGEALIQIVRVGVCGTDIEFFNGDMPYLHDGQAKYPIRIGHEWSGIVIGLGKGADSKLLGKRVIGDVMMGCGNCNRCKDGRQHTCVDRYEMGIRNGWNGALAEQLVIPTRFLYLLPDSIDETVGALVEPGANAWRVAVAAQAAPGKRILIWGTGTIGLYALLFAKAMGAQVHMIGKDPTTIKLALELGAASAGEDLKEFKDGYNSIVDATFDPSIPAKAVSLVEPGGHVVLIGVDGNGAPIDSRKLVLKDVTVVGILSGSPGLAHSIDFIASGRVDPRPLVGATVGLSEVGPFFMGIRPIGAGVGPKILVDPTR